MAFCRNCGSRVGDREKICKMCGAEQTLSNDNNNNNMSTPEKEKSMKSGDNINLFALFSFLCAIVMLFIPMIQRSLILIVGAVGTALGLVAMVKKKPAASSFQNYVLPIISILMCIIFIAYNQFFWNDFLNNL